MVCGKSLPCHEWIRLKSRNYVSEIKPFAQAQRIGEDGVVRTFRYPTEGENPTPFYENLRATLPGVRDLLAKIRVSADLIGSERFSRPTIPRGRT